MMPLHASLMYSRNVAALLDLLIDKEGNLNLNLDDEVIDAMCVAHAGEARHELGRKAG
jgi:NAD(P) transhydrogenase subunit alpha